MVPKDIIVLIDRSNKSAAHVDTALVMAQKFNSHLIGIYTAEPNVDSLSVMALLESGRRKIESEITYSSELMFRNKVEQEGWADKSIFLKLEGGPNKVAAVVSRYADLIVAGQPNQNNDHLAGVDSLEVVAVSGRPMFVVPQDFKPKGYTGHAVLAWNGSREAGRALSDAMMILEPESKISIVTVGKGNHCPQNYGFDIRIHLERHGIKAKNIMLIALTRTDPGMDLVNFTDREGADVLIMGAYSTSRFRQKIFGGTTHTVLKNMRTPVFLSH